QTAWHGPVTAAHQIIGTGMSWHCVIGHDIALIAGASRDARVPKIEIINENIWENQVMDITKIRDDMNPKKKKKRKREPMISHASETTVGIDSQAVANMTMQNNTRLTSLIEHIPNMIKRAIDKALAPVHIKIQDLEHRVSELEGIGTREALAVLKADMSKPDLSIFDALLLEDEVFEDERAETDEEELEEEHEIPIRKRVRINQVKIIEESSQEAEIQPNASKVWTVVGYTQNTDGQHLNTENQPLPIDNTQTHTPDKVQGFFKGLFKDYKVKFKWEILRS
ncbi:hypothetical protein HAX54_018958, partial [Datura stramonium]|nr:hypothetical protein [Datura stramonium]